MESIGNNWFKWISRNEKMDLGTKVDQMTWRYSDEIDRWYLDGIGWKQLIQMNLQTRKYVELKQIRRWLGVWTRNCYILHHGAKSDSPWKTDWWVSKREWAISRKSWKGNWKWNRPRFLTVLYEILRPMWLLLENEDNESIGSHYRGHARCTE